MDIKTTTATKQTNEDNKNQGSIRGSSAKNIAVSFHALWINI